MANRREDQNAPAQQGGDRSREIANRDDDMIRGGGDDMLDRDEEFEQDEESDNEADEEEGNF